MESLFSYVSCEARVPRDHPVRPIRAIVDKALEVLSPQFEGLYATTGRPSIPPEKLLRALLVEAFYSVRSERQLMEQLDDNLLFRCSSGWRWTRPWDVTVFTKNRERLLAGEIAQKFLAALLAQLRIRMLLSDDPFSVDGTLIEAWASMKSLRPKDASEDGPDGGARGRNGERNFHGEKRSNDTHASTTDPAAISVRNEKQGSVRRPSVRPAVKGLEPGWTHRARRLARHRSRGAPCRATPDSTRVDQRAGDDRQRLSL